MSDADVGMAARAAFKAIQAKARAEQNKNTQGLLVVYGIQGFLRRLSMSPYATKMTLKGGMLMAAKNIRQMTKDADLSTHGVRNDQAELISLVTEIANITPEPHDGLVFATSTIKAELMREDADYHGVRVKAACSLSTARFGVALDFSFGDRDSVTMIDLPALLGDEPIRLAAYPFELNIAEKIATMMSRRELNTRDRDFADVWVTSRTHPISARELRGHIVSVAALRHHPVIELAHALEHMPDRQRDYLRMLDRMGYQCLPPTTHAQLIQDVIAFCDPLIADEAGALTGWDPDTLTWS